MSRRTALWLGFAVVVLHNLEEHLTMGAFLAEHSVQMPSALQSVTGDRFAVSLAIVTLLLLLLTWAAARSRPRGVWLVLAVAVQVGLGVNALQHAAVAAWARGYAPGVATGLLLSLPYAAYLVRRALREDWVALGPLALAAAAVLVLTPPTVMALHALSALVL